MSFVSRLILIVSVVALGTALLLSSAQAEMRCEIGMGHAIAEDVPCPMDMARDCASCVGTLAPDALPALSYAGCARHRPLSGDLSGGSTSLAQDPPPPRGWRLIDDTQRS
jgi:hypothetical protein